MGDHFATAPLNLRNLLKVLFYFIQKSCELLHFFLCQGRGEGIVCFFIEGGVFFREFLPLLCHGEDQVPVIGGVGRPLDEVFLFKALCQDFTVFGVFR